MEERAPSPTTPEPPSPSGSEDTEEGRTRQNTMAATAEQGGASSSETKPILKQEQMKQIIAFLSGGTRRHKAKEPQVYRGERHKLRGWLAQHILYYRTVGWQSGHDEDKILFATSLVRDNAGSWKTPYAEEGITPTWDIWAGFKAQLQRQLGVIHGKGEARMRVKNMKLGKRSVTEYWKEFPLVASEAELNNSTGGELLLGGMVL